MSSMLQVTTAVLLIECENNFLTKRYDDNDVAGYQLIR